MSTSADRVVAFLDDLMRRRGISANQLAHDLGLSHATLSRWLSKKDLPSPRSCQKLADVSGVQLERILSLAGHMPELSEIDADELPEFREYARVKYSTELDEDLITMTEDLIERRRKRHEQCGNIE